MIRTILVPLDGSAFGEQALRHATLIAHRADAQVHLAHVLMPLVFADPMMQYTALDVETPRDAQAYLGDLLGRLPEPVPAQPPTAVVLEGPVTDALTKYVEDTGIDLVVMASHGRGPFARAWMGSVSDELMRSVSAPVMLIRAIGEEEPAAATTAADFGHMLLALDGTRESEEILGPASELGRLFGSRLTLLRVAVPGWDKPSEDLDAVAGNLRDRGFTVQTNQIEHDDPAAAIVAEAERLGCDLIAMVTHNRSGLARLFLGSVTDRVIREAECPVLVHSPASSPDATRSETMSADELVTVYVGPDALLARVIAAHLSNEGIQCTISGENQAGFTGVPAVSVDVLVHAADAERARELIEAHERSHADDVEEAETA